jgi:hypothetical protein
MRQLLPAVVLIGWASVGVPALRAQPSPAEKAALEKLQKLGAFFREGVDDPLQTKPKIRYFVSIKTSADGLKPSEVTDADLQLLKDIPRIFSLELASPHVSDDGLQILKHLDDLQFLILDSNKLTDRGMKAIGELKQLRNLSLQVSKLTDKGLNELHALNKLEFLDIRHFDLSDAAIAQLKQKLPQLSKNAKDSRFLQKGLRVEKLPNLLRLPPVEVTPQDDAIGRLVKLRYNAALESVGFQYQRIMAGIRSPDEGLWEVLAGLVDATLERGDIPEKSVVLDSTSEVLEMISALNESIVKSGRITSADAARTRYEVLTLQLRILRAKQAKGKTP